MYNLGVYPATAVAKLDVFITHLHKSSKHMVDVFFTLQY
jgi:hypothetical protein